MKIRTLQSPFEVGLNIVLTNYDSKNSLSVNMKQLLPLRGWYSCSLEPPLKTWLVVDPGDFHTKWEPMKKVIFKDCTYSTFSQKWKWLWSLAQIPGSAKTTNVGDGYSKLSMLSISRSVTISSRTQINNHRILMKMNTAVPSFCFLFLFCIGKLSVNSSNKPEHKKVVTGIPMNTLIGGCS